jgi:hypothetical protein
LGRPGGPGGVEHGPPEHRVVDVVAGLLPHCLVVGLEPVDVPRHGQAHLDLRQVADGLGDGAGEARVADDGTRR